MRSVLASRTSGILQLSGRELSELPPEAFDPDSATAEGTVNWWEVTELTKLVASHNKLTHLQPEVATLTTLVTLDLGHNHLQALPNSLCELQQLKVLDVTANRFTELPAHVADLPSLVRLLCGDNSLSSLPAGIGAAQPDLAEVSAPGNRIESLPPGLVRCQSLMRLNLQGNQVSRLAVLAGMVSLTDLNLRQNRISGTLDPAIGSLTAVKVLDLRENAIEAIPDEIGSCSSLVELLAGHNSLCSVPGAVAKCPELSILDLRKNRLRTLPPDISGCARLSLLDLTDNELSMLPPELGLLTTLRRLPLDGNPLRALRNELAVGPTPKLLQWLRDKIPDNAGAVGQREAGPAARSGNVFGEDSATLAAAAASRITISDHHQPRELILSGSGLGDVPPEVWDAAASGLLVLDLSRNAITAVDPTSLAKAKQLTTLRLGSNRIGDWPLPQEPGSLPCLQEVSLAGNAIPRAPAVPFASCAAALRRLDLSGVPAAATLPHGALSVLTSLEELHLRQAALACFPIDVVEAPLRSLRVLNVQSNAIPELPEAVTLLTNLEELDVSNNDLSNIPPAVGLMTKLRSLAVEGNRLRTIRRPVLERGTKAILEYLRDRIPS